MDAAAFRAEFPVLDRTAYLNAGTDGPVPSAAVAAVQTVLQAQLEAGRYGRHFEARREAIEELRRAYARVVGAEPADIALKTSTSEGIGSVLAGLDLGPGHEIVTSDSEHPGLIGPLIAARARGVKVTAVPLAEVADAVTPRTTLVACSHVSWVDGELAPAALAELDIPVILDGAQGAGAIPVDVHALGCAAYAAAGQKWLCGADGTGLLYLSPAFRERVRAIAPSYVSFEDIAQETLHADARRYDTPSLSREATTFTLASTQLLERYGLAAVQARARDLAARFAHALTARGRTVAPRDGTTLVAWEDSDPPATAARLAAAGVVGRHLPGTPYLRVSVGAWNDESDLERLLAAL
ncbi:MAG TPA: aminotransferase class V-fold PLP-dependent enzyme [Solirubrobacteraceae bacterium]|nr:aminotransferase class V-fold PLP-dependent enzyme [Solirubrobacteraceae bacterium]